MGKKKKRIKCKNSVPKKQRSSTVRQNRGNAKNDEKTNGGLVLVGQCPYKHLLQGQKIPLSSQSWLYPALTKLSRSNNASAFRGFKLEKVQCVSNDMLEAKYEEERKLILGKCMRILEDEEGKRERIGFLETYSFHGTSWSAAEKIVKEGFNTRMVWSSSHPDISIGYSLGKSENHQLRMVLCRTLCVGSENQSPLWKDVYAVSNPHRCLPLAILSFSKPNSKTTPPSNANSSSCIIS